MKKLYVITVTIILLISAGMFAYLFRTIDQSARAGLKIEILKVLLQLAAIAIVGGFVTWILNERSKEKEREAARLQKEAERQTLLNEFRRSIIARVVAATNVVRKAPILIQSHQSKKTYGEQIRAILDAKLDLSLVRHEQASSNAFNNPDDINKAIQKMEEYLEFLIEEWKDKYKHLPVEPPDKAWNALKGLEALGDLMRGDKTSQFDNKYLMGHKEVLELMRNDMFSPRT